MNSVIFNPSHDQMSRPRFQPAEPPGPRLKQDVARSLHMHRSLALAVSLALFAMLAAFAFVRSPSYEATALVYVQPEKARVVTDPTEGTYDQIRYDSYIQQQIQTILRTDTLSNAIKEAAAQPGGDHWTAPGESLQSATMRLQKQLKVEREMGSYQLSVTLDGRDPFWTTTLLNAVVRTYIAQERTDELAQDDQRLNLLKQDRESILTELAQNTDEQAKLSSTLGVAQPPTSADNSSTPVSPLDSQLSALRTQLEEARAAHAVAEASLSSVSGPAAEDSLDAAAEANSANDPALAALRQTISQRRSQLATQMAALTPKNPLYKQDQDELARLDQSLDAMSSELRQKTAQQLIGSLRLDAARTGDVEARLAAQLAQQTAMATGATPKLQRAEFLAADIARLQARYTEVDNAINSLELEHNSLGLVHLLLPADVPAKPKSTHKWLILAAAIPFSLGCGLFAAWIRHKADPRLYIADDMLPVLGFPPMAVLPASKDILHERVADEFTMRLVAGIEQSHVSGGASTYVFTPVSANTDISAIVAALAAKMERLGYRTVILKASAALQSNAVNTEEKFRERCGVRLSTMMGNHVNETQRTSLVSENLERIKQNTELIFIEALPLLSSAESEFAARIADITVLVAESGVTTHKELASTLALTRRLNAAGIAVVLSELELQHADPEFLFSVRSVEKRTVETRREDSPAIRGQLMTSLQLGQQSTARKQDASSHSWSIHT